MIGVGVLTNKWHEFRTELLKENLKEPSFLKQLSKNGTLHVELSNFAQN